MDKEGLSESSGILTEETKALASCISEIILSRGEVRQTGQCYCKDQAKGYVTLASGTQGRRNIYTCFQEWAEIGEWVRHKAGRRQLRQRCVVGNRA